MRSCRSWLGQAERGWRERLGADRARTLIALLEELEGILDAGVEGGIANPCEPCRTASPCASTISMPKWRAAGPRRSSTDPWAEALAIAAQQPETVQDGLYLATDNDVVAYLDLIEGLSPISRLC